MSAPGSRAWDLARWLEHLERLHPSAVDLGLSRVETVRRALGLALGMPVITVGGTNGKGSVCAYLEAILREAGYRVGLYTSPHLLRYNERVRIDAQPVDDVPLIAAFERIEQARAATSLTYFEFGTLAAASLFREASVEVAILEVGLGGRLDAVNVFDADCAVVVSVDLDHMRYLGDTREAIGYEKAGIFRAARPAICADESPPESLRRHAHAVGARLLSIGSEFGYRTDGVQWRYWGPNTVRGGLPFPALRGGHQLANAAAAIAALDELRTRLPVGNQAIRMGLVTAAAPGRYQVLPGRPSVVLDVAHNPHAARALRSNLEAHRAFRRTLAVFAMLGDKDIGGVIEAVKACIDVWYLAPLSGERAMSVEGLRTLVAKHDSGKPMHAFDSVAAAFAGAQEAAEDGDRILVFGSFHTVAEVMALRARRRDGRRTMP